ncbi:hypothetical protein STEG23_032506 [Scotinomys teguina]
MPVDLQGDNSLQVEISDAVSERDKVKFTVQTKGVAIFKKTVAMEVFLQCLAAHPTLHQDHNFSVFLEYSQDEVDDFFEHERTFLVEYHNPRHLPEG